MLVLVHGLQTTLVNDRDSRLCCHGSGSYGVCDSVVASWFVHIRKDKEVICKTFSPSILGNEVPKDGRR